MDNFRVVRVAVVLACALAGLTASASSALADFRFCNKTNKTVYINFVQPDDDCDGLGGWSGWGWYTAAPNKCTTVLSGNLGNRYYYYHAHSADRAYVWNGNSNGTWRWWMPNAAHEGWCIDLAQTQGGATHAHRQVDTGAYTGWTVNLTSNASCSAWNCFRASIDQCLCSVE